MQAFGAPGPDGGTAIVHMPANNVSCQMERLNRVSSPQPRKPLQVQCADGGTWVDLRPSVDGTHNVTLFHSTVHAYSPPINLTSCAEIRTGPVPPCFARRRKVACANASNSAPVASGRRRCPVGDFKTIVTPMLVPGGAACRATTRLAGEFDRIAGQIGRRIGADRTIAEKQLRHVVVDRSGDLDPLAAGTQAPCR